MVPAKATQSWRTARLRLVTEVTPRRISETRRLRTDFPRYDHIRQRTAAEPDSHGAPGLSRRLRECKLVQWVLAYVALAWVALQMTDALREIWSWPAGLPRGITLALGLGIFPATVIAWYHGERGRQRVCVLEVTILGVLLVGLGWLVWWVCA